jgi:hypothetical protein
MAWHGEGARVSAGLHRAAGWRRAGEGQRPGEEGGPDRWGPPVGGRRRRADTLSGLSQDGPWAKSGAGPNRSPMAFSSFPISFSFFFSILSFLLYNLQKCFK